MPVVRDWFIISVMELEISYLICLSILTDNPSCPQLDLVFKPSIMLTVYSMSISLNLKLTLFTGECKSSLIYLCWLGFGKLVLCQYWKKYVLN